VDGVFSPLDFHSLSEVIPGTDAAFWQALVAAGWLQVCSESIIIPEFEKWLGSSAKKRLKDARRKRDNPENPTLSSDLSPLKNGNKTEQKRLRETETGRETSKGKNSLSIPSCPEPDKPASEPAVLTFPTNGKPETWDLLPSKLAEWSGTFPGLDCLAECRKALQWVKDNRRKTAKGMPRFLLSWLGRANDQPRAGSGVGKIAPAGAVDKQQAGARAIREAMEQIYGPDGVPGVAVAGRSVPQTTGGLF
jgi:hypothetical protein